MVERAVAGRLTLEPGDVGALVAVSEGVDRIADPDAPSAQRHLLRELVLGEDRRAMGIGERAVEEPVARPGDERSADDRDDDAERGRDDEGRSDRPPRPEPEPKA